MAHWFEKMQHDAQKQSEHFVQSFQDFEKKSTVNIAHFAQEIQKNSVRENDDLRERLLGQSRNLVDEFQDNKSEESLKLVEETFAKLQVLDRVVDFQLTGEKIKAKEEQIMHLNRMSQGLGHPGYQQSINELSHKEREQLGLLQEEKQAKHQLIHSTVDFYHTEDKVEKLSIERDINQKNNNISRIKHQAETNSKRLMNQFTGDRFHYEALNMASRSRVVPDVERSAMQIAKLNDQQVEFAQKYSFVKKQAQTQIEYTLDKEKKSERSKLEDMFL